MEPNVKFRALNISFQLADMSKDHTLSHLILTTQTTYNLEMKQKLKKTISI